MKELQDILRAIRAAGGQELGLATLVRVEGHSFRRPGARMLMDQIGPRLGSLSGGCLEADVFARWREAPERPRVISYDLRGDLDLIWGTGSGCEGLAEILVETVDPQAPWLDFLEQSLAARSPGWLQVTTADADLGLRCWGRAGEPIPAGGFTERIQPPIQLWILGAGDDALPLVHLARTLGWTVGVADHRPAFANHGRFPEADEVRAAQPAVLVPSLKLDPRSAVVLITHNYAKDLEALRGLLPSTAGYIGLMGHRRRGARLLAALEAEGMDFTAQQLIRFHHPVGLDLGAEAPETLALAILAEIQAVLAGRRGMPLRERSGAIHGVLA
ncbi:MAG: XdhC family protein [Holophagaceae bacterium]|nr:XdhC family protein [Holophagaceae bacterium]